MFLRLYKYWNRRNLVYFRGLRFIQILLLWLSCLNLQYIGIGHHFYCDKYLNTILPRFSHVSQIFLCLPLDKWLITNIFSNGTIRRISWRDYDKLSLLWILEMFVTGIPLQHAATSLHHSRGWLYNPCKSIPVLITI